MPITPLPPPPSRTVPATFADLGDAFLGALPTFATEMEDARQTAAQAIADSATAAAAADAAVAATGVSVWVSGTTYAVGDNRFSPIDFFTYRRKTAGAGTTDPSLDTTNWKLISAKTVGAGGTTYSGGDLTLTHTSVAVHSITMTGYGKSVTLPDATGLQEGTLFVLHNAGKYEFVVRDSTGAGLCFVHPGAAATVSCADNSVAAGSWVVDGGLDYGLDVNAAVNIGDVAYTAYGARLVELDATRKLLITISTTEINAVVYDEAAQSFGSAALVRTAATAGYVAAIKTGTDAVLVVSSAGTAMQAVLLTFSGTAITVNTAASATLGQAASGVPKLVTVAGTGSCACLSVCGYTYLHAISISGTTVAIGTATTVTTNTSQTNALHDIGGGKVLAVYSAANLSVNTYAISGTTITAGTAAAGPAGTGNLPVLISRLLPSGRVAIVSASTANLFVGMIASLSGTVSSISSVTLGAATMARTHAFAVASGNQVLFIGGGAGVAKANVLTDSSGTAVAGTEISFSGIFSATSRPRIMQDTGTELVVLARSADSEARLITGRLSISGNDPAYTPGAVTLVLPTTSYANQFGDDPLIGSETWYSNPSYAEALSGTRRGVFYGKRSDLAGVSQTVGTDGDTITTMPLIASVFDTILGGVYESKSAVWGFAPHPTTGYQIIQRMRIL